jgi:hypothetical protein
VIPDYLRALTVIQTDTEEEFTFPNSAFGEVKAVTGNLTLGYSYSQILGLIDVARLAPVTSAPVTFGPPPVLEFITTGNTGIPGPTIQKATIWGVLLFQQMVYEVPVMADDPNPDLCLGAKRPLNAWIFPGQIKASGPAWSCTKLTSPPPDWVTLIPGDPDPPTVN